MITGKQRSYLKSLAHNIDPSVYVGKGGLTDNVVKEIEICLEARELIKVKLQDGCFIDAKDAANHISTLIGAEYVQAIGRKFVIYKKSSQNAQIVLPRN